MPPSKKNTAPRPSAARNSGGDFERITHQRAHEYIAEQLRRHIGLRLVLPGEALPTDRELAQIFGAGRATVQMAIGILAAEGLIETKRGRGGGTFVRFPNRDAASQDTLLMDLMQKRRQVEDALEFRRVMEPAAAAYAARRCTSQDIAGMQMASDAMRTSTSEEDYMRHDTDLHLRIARASQNEEIYVALERIRLILNRALEALPESPTWHDRLNSEHDLIVTTIERREPDAAHALMLAHVQSAEQAIRAVFAQLTRNNTYLQRA